MPDPTTIFINPELAIPVSEVWFEFSHSSGPGGQHANKVSTRATLCFDVSCSAALTPAQRARVLMSHCSRINSDGLMRVSCGQSRSQAANRLAAMARFAELIAQALRTPRRRRPTRASAASRQRRVQDKRLRGERKQSRRPPEAD